MQLTRPLNSQRRKRSGLRSLVLGFVLTTIVLAVWSNKQYIADSISFWQYEPSAAVEQITSRTELSDAGKFSFYSAQPVVETGDAYNNVCGHHEENTAILGCYTGNRIYLYDVTDTRLDGIEEVTAAHEMLHAVYQRLSDTEKQSVNRLLDSEYEKLKVDPDYTERMAYYARTEPGQKHNELHSIIATEIASISSELESHYKKYFNDRSKVVALYDRYNGTFVELENKRKLLSVQLEALSTDIENMSAIYANDARILMSDIDTFNRRADASDFSSPAQFSRERQVLVDRSNELTTRQGRINKMITELNTLKDEYNGTVTQSKDLYKSLDSSVGPAPKV